ncbi:hypothetical protein [Spirosoma pomorum]
MKDQKYLAAVLVVFMLCATLCISISIAEYSNYNREKLWLGRDRLVDSLKAQIYKEVKYEFWKDHSHNPSEDDE